MVTTSTQTWNSHRCTDIIDLSFILSILKFSCEHLLFVVNSLLINLNINPNTINETLNPIWSVCHPIFSALGSAHPQWFSSFRRSHLRGGGNYPSLKKCDTFGPNAIVPLHCMDLHNSYLDKDYADWVNHNDKFPTSSLYNELKVSKNRTTLDRPAVAGAVQTFHLPGKSESSLLPAGFLTAWFLQKLYSLWNDGGIGVGLLCLFVWVNGKV